MRLSIIIISYNTRDLTLACLRSVYQETCSDRAEVIVVDNASSDGSAQAVSAEFPQVRMIASSENLGFARANNLAATHARGSWLLLLNPDTLVQDRAIDKLLSFAESHPEAGIFGGRTLFPDGSLNAASCWRRPTPWSVLCISTGLTSLLRRSPVFARESYGSWQRDSVREVDIVSGCFLLIRRDLWEQLGGFDPMFFMYGEEADLCLRARAMGHRCLINPEASIVHYGGASERVRADKMVRLLKAKAMLFQRHWTPWSRWFGVRCLDLWALSRLGAFAVLKRWKADRAQAYDTWRKIWRERVQWHTST